MDSHVRIIAESCLHLCIGQLTTHEFARVQVLECLLHILLDLNSMEVVRWNSVESFSRPMNELIVEFFSDGDAWDTIEYKASTGESIISTIQLLLTKRHRLAAMNKPDVYPSVWKYIESKLPGWTLAENIPQLVVNHVWMVALKDMEPEFVDLLLASSLGFAIRAHSSVCVPSGHAIPLLFWTFWNQQMYQHLVNKELLHDDLVDGRGLPLVASILYNFPGVCLNIPGCLVQKEALRRSFVPYIRGAPETETTLVEFAKTHCSHLHQLAVKHVCASIGFE